MKLSLGKDKKIYNIILEKQVKELIDEIARIEDRSSSNLINRILKKYVEDTDAITKNEVQDLWDLDMKKETKQEN